MRIFFICHRVPYPPDRGDKIATFNLLRHLSSMHEVHVFSRCDGPIDDGNVAALKDYASSVTAVASSMAAEAVRGFKALVSGAPLTVAYANESRLRHAISAKSVDLPPDLIFVYSGEMAQYAEVFPNVPRIMHLSELDSQKWAAYGEQRGFPLNWVYRREANLLHAHERRIARTFSHTLVCSLAERRDFERLIPGSRVSVIANGVDLDRFSSRHVPKRPGAMIFTGVMDYFPNADAATWFCEEVLPLVREAVPHATFVICGRRPTAMVTRLARLPGVTVTGEVGDVRPYLDEAEICVVPTRIARGIQNKLLEGLAMGLPCVSSRCSWSGTVIREGEGVLVADDAKGFAAHTIRLLEDRQYREGMGETARAAVEEKYTWDEQFRLLDRIVEHVTCAGQEQTGSQIALDYSYAEAMP